MLFCVIGRFMNIFPLSCIANLCRGKKNPSNYITWKMQSVLCFAGLRGAIAFALALNMPGPNAETYTTVTLTICGITTVVCGGFTEKIICLFGMKESNESSAQIDSTETDFDDEEDNENFSLFSSSSIVHSRNIGLAYDGMKGLWRDFDIKYLRPMFGGSANSISIRTTNPDQRDDLGHYELGTINEHDKEGKDALWEE